MFRHDSLLNAVLPKHFRLAAVTVALAPALLVAGSGAWAQEGPVSLLFTIPVPVAASNTTGGMYGFDISWVNR